MKSLGRWFRCWSVMGLAMVVTSLAAEDKWLRVTATDFTLITALKQKEAVAWADDFAQFVDALGQVIPVNQQRLPHLTIVVFARDRDFTGYKPLDGAGKPKAMAGFFSRHLDTKKGGLKTRPYF